MKRVLRWLSNSRSYYIVLFMLSNVVTFSLIAVLVISHTFLTMSEVQLSCDAVLRAENERRFVIRKIDFKT